MKTATLLFCLFSLLQSQNLTINTLDYFEKKGLNVMVFSDIYPEGHQTGVSVIQHGMRVAANGDVRLEASPGQWSAIPKAGKQTVDRDKQKITQRLWFPDSSRNRKGFNPIIYPDLLFKYDVSVQALSGNSFKITVDLDQPLPEEWTGKIGFNIELFPGCLFGKSFLMDDQPGYFPLQPNGPVREDHGEFLAIAMATGKKLVIAAEEDKQRMIIESFSGELVLLDGRSNHNNSWFIVRTLLAAGKTKKALEWIITPNVIEGWRYEPVIQVSQLGYHPDQPKKVIIEQDANDEKTDIIHLFKIDGQGKREIKKDRPSVWGKFLRYTYLTYDFSDVREKGLYVIEYRNKKSHAFRIDAAVFDRDAWQPVVDYYLPVQMCHMRVNEKYRVWHGACHLDDALMAPLDTNLFDGYKQGPSTLTTFKPYDPVPQLNRGGWHDAGDYDLRVESQIGTVMLLSLMIEEFGLDYDVTTIDEENRIVEIHQPDGKNDLIQQIEHGLLTILGGYRAMGRFYRGIICNDLRQYVMLGDGSTMTDNQVYNGQGKMDDRWVFTAENANRSLQVAAGLAAASRVLKNANPSLSKECLDIALQVWQEEKDNARLPAVKIMTLCELFLSTNDPLFEQAIIALKPQTTTLLPFVAPSLGRVIDKIKNIAFKSELADSVAGYIAKLKENSETDSPYGVPYQPRIWGAGWDIQRFGVAQYFIHKGWPQLASENFYLNALNFILGVHPGENTASFASGVGSNSVRIAYGVNRADWSFIPGGVVSGTALIKPDLPELKEWPFFWQQTEYVMGGGSTNYMFLVLAAKKLFNN
jgi:endoglucanase